MTDESPEPLLTVSEIQRRVSELAEEISQDYSEVKEILMIGVLRGAFIFLADLSRQIEVPRRVDFMALASYDSGAVQADAVRLIMDLRSDIRDKHVLVVEDIVDTGHTLAYLLETLAARRPASLKTCALVRKPARHEVPVNLDYVGFEIPDVWVVGYGLDFADRHRTLPYIGALEMDGDAS